MPRALSFLIPAAFAVLPPALNAQSESDPTISVAGTGSVELAPDFATMGIGVRVQSNSPIAASDQMSESIDAIVDTLSALGFPGESLPTRVFAIGTDRNRLDGSNTITGYSAAVTLEVRTTELDRLAEFVGAAIAAGATEVSRITFDASDRAAAREEALRRAVQAAERDAEVIAEAGGSVLGRLIEMSTLRPDQAIRIRGSSALSGVTASALVPPMITVEATVTATWVLNEQ